MKLNYRKLILLLADIFMISVSGVILNYILSLVGWIGPEGNKGLLYFIILNDLTCVLMLLISGAYNKLWRYFNIRDYIFSGAAMAVGFAMSYGILLLLGHRPRKIFWVLFFIMTSLGVLLFRYIFKRTFLDLTKVGERESLVRTLIVGAGQAGRLILREIENSQFDENNPSKNLLPVGFVDDDITKQREEHRIENIIVAIPSCDGEEKRRILDICSRTKCKIKVIPYISELIFSEGEQLITQAKEIKIEDLLGRTPIEFDRLKISGFIKGKSCMITGGGGSIGSELVRQIAQYSPRKIIIVDIYENNAYDIQQELILKYGDGLDFITLISSVRDYNKMEMVFKEYRPQLVFHAAAHKHVPLMETVPEEAVKNNIFGTYNVATLAQRYNADKFVMISTDKAVNPTNVMGATKRACEMIIQYMAQTTTHTEFVTTRFGNVLGSNGSVIPLFRKQIESGNPVTVTHPDIIRYFMTIPEAVSLVLEAGAMAKGGEIFVLDMGAPVKITTLAENLIRMYGKVPNKDIPIVFTGLRPGEKLFEELLMDEEGLKSTGNKKIFIGNQIEINEEELLAKLDRLRKVSEKNDSESTVAILADIVPTFHHSTTG